MQVSGRAWDSSACSLASGWWNAAPRLADVLGTRLAYLRTKREKMGHLLELDDLSKRRCGDLVLAAARGIYGLSRARVLLGASRPIRAGAPDLDPPPRRAALGCSSPSRPPVRLPLLRQQTSSGRPL